MCILSGKEIENRAGEIFSRDSWAQESFQEASYDLRVDTKPYLRIGGELYEPGRCYDKSYIRIEPGELAMLPTVESFSMPEDLVGTIKIKFNYSRKGLTPLFGPKVDPYFGRGHKDERLYLWVSNLGLDTITVDSGKPVFTVQFHTLIGERPEFKKKPPTGQTISRELHAGGHGKSLGFIDTMRDQVTAELSDRLSRVEHGTQQVVLFGVFLVASALLASSFAAMFAMVFALNTDTGVTMVNALSGSLLGIVLCTVGVLLSIAVIVLLGATLFQFIRPTRRVNT